MPSLSKEELYSLDKRAILEVQQDLADIGCSHDFLTGVRLASKLVITYRPSVATRPVMNPYLGVCICTDFYTTYEYEGKMYKKNFCVLVEGGSKSLGLINSRKVLTLKNWHYKTLKLRVRGARVYRESFSYEASRELSKTTKEIYSI